jgi:hypothetical protein
MGLAATVVDVIGRPFPLSPQKRLAFVVESLIERGPVQQQWATAALCSKIPL